MNREKSDYKKLVSDLVSRVDIRSLLAIALLESPVGREEDLAITCTELVLKLDPGNSRAAILSGYQALNYWLDDTHVNQSIRLLERLLEEGKKEIGAAAILLDRLREWRSKRNSYVVDIELMRRSIESEPGWATNHFLLGIALLKQGAGPAAEIEFDTALGNLIDQAEDLSPEQEAFEICFTGRLGVRESLSEVIGLALAKGAHPKRNSP